MDESKARARLEIMEQGYAACLKMKHKRREGLGSRQALGALCEIWKISRQQDFGLADGSRCSASDEINLDRDR